MGFVEHFHNLEKMGFGMTPREVREIVFDFCKEKGVPNNVDNKNKLPGEDWFSGLRKRHPNITLRKPKGLSLVRVNTVNRAAVKRYFQRLNSTLNITGADRDVSRMYNCDESGLSMVEGTKLVVGKTGRLISYQIQSSERGVLTTIVPCASASGHFIPPFTGFPHGTFVTVTKSGHMDKETFVMWMKHFQKHRPNNEEPELLYAVKHKIKKVCLCPHTTHWTQPLDRTFFKSLKSFYRENCRNVMRTHPEKARTRDEFSTIFTPTYLHAATMHNVIKGFRITGICPLDENVFPEESFAPREVTNDPQTNELIDKSGNTAVHEDMDEQVDPDDTRTSQSYSENEEADTTGIGNEVGYTGVTDDSHNDTGGNTELVVSKQVKGKQLPTVLKSQPVAILHGPSTSGVNVRTQPQKSLQEQSNCGKCEGDFFDDEEGDP
ncbi:hypothetical protein PR048_005191 [Dryococelus australis]|uniref:Uncharacterized protein n=1 Tax=Dryococelus australis TaxID=614101 RepID=A0ABQ9I7K9_9NEOP|nr:hypothetical protein PR048_005191 [Dryococelus australis]